MLLRSRVGSLIAFIEQAGPRDPVGEQEVQMIPWFKGEIGQSRAAVIAFFVLAGLSFSAWAVRIPDVKSALGRDDATLGLALLGTAAGSVVAMPASGWTIARFGSRWVTVTAALLTCATLVLPALTPTAPLL